MQLQKLTFLFAFILFTSIAHAQWSGSGLTNPIYRTGYTAIGTTTVNNSAMLFVDGGQTTGANHLRAVSGIMSSGSGYAYGVQGTSYNQTPSTAGRAYGVYGQAGNATDGANYGVYSRLFGSNSGAALLATDDVNFFDPTGNQYLLGNKTWAGYFIGDTHMSSRLGIRSTDPKSMLSVGGDGHADWTGYFHTNSNTNGSRAIHAEADQPIGGADHVRSISGVIQSGSGYAYGVQGSATNPNPSGAGRSYGVYGQAGNATDGANYGVYSRLMGSNAGTALLATDDVNFFDPTGNQYLLGNQTWAGYFIGNVQMTEALGIGCTTMNPLPTGSSGTHNYRLFVDGGIAGRELLIQNGGNWCDYVFENDYELMTLEEVETHIQEKGHLHKTPSAAEYKANGGFEVSEVTLNQQEKIEEIFLHLIDLKKEVKALKAENETLKTQLATKR